MAISEGTAGGSARPGPANGGYRAHYIRDAQGNIMATYRFNPASLVLNDRPIYGSAPLGNHRFDEQVFHASPATPYYPPPPSHIQKADLNYELTGHLGNVAVVVTGRLITNELGITPCQAELVSAQGYEPFGSLLPGRNYSSDSYNYGYNGKLKDDEVHGATGTSYDYGFRIYDPRVARFLSIDPLSKSFPWYTPYQFAGNKPIWCKDLDGLEDVVYWKNTVIEPGFRGQTTRTAKWSDLYPGEKHGPLGHGTLTFTTTTARTPSGIDVTSVTREQFTPPPPPASESMWESLSNEVSSWFGGTWGTGGPGGEMREKGKNGAAWDPEIFMLVVDKLKKGFPEKFKYDKHMPGRQSETSDKLSEDKSGRHEGYAKDPEGGPSNATETGVPTHSLDDTIQITIDTTWYEKSVSGRSQRWDGHKTIRTTPRDTIGKNYQLTK